MEVLRPNSNPIPLELGPSCTNELREGGTENGDENFGNILLACSGNSDSEFDSVDFWGDVEVDSPFEEDDGLLIDSLQGTEFDSYRRETWLLQFCSK